MYALADEIICGLYDKKNLIKSVEIIEGEEVTK